MELTPDEIRLVLGWAAATDFEAKLDAEDFPLIKRLAAEVGENLDTYAGVYLATHSD